MTDQRKQKSTPKGIDPKTGKPYHSIKREEWSKLLKRAARTGRNPD